MRGTWIVFRHKTIGVRQVRNLLFRMAFRARWVGVPLPLEVETTEEAFGEAVRESVGDSGRSSDGRSGTGRYGRACLGSGFRRMQDGLDR